MRRFGYRWTAYAVSLLLIGAIVLGYTPVVRADCPGNALANGSFEDGFSERGAGEVWVANGWDPWWEGGPFSHEGLNVRPEFKAEDASRFGYKRIRDGHWAQKWGSTHATHNAGLFQRVNVPAGSDLTLRAWAQSWSSAEHDPNVSTGGRYFLSVGIDPTGGTDWASPEVVWSERNITMDQWVQLTVQTKAKAGTVTIYLRGQAEFRLSHNDAYFDDVCLTVVAPPPPPTRVPPPTAIPTQTPLPTATATMTPLPEPTATATPVPGTIKALAFDDLNRNSVRDSGEPLVAGAQIVLSNLQRTPIAQHKTDGVAEPRVFGGLTPGSYIVTETDPPGYTSVSPNEVMVVLPAGGEIEVAFADRAQLAATSTVTAQPQPTATVSAPTHTAAPTGIATMKATAPVVRPTDPPQNIDSPQGGLSAISGIIVLAVAIALPFSWRYLRKRV